MIQMLPENKKKKKQFFYKFEFVYNGEEYLYVIFVIFITIILVCNIQ